VNFVDLLCTLIFTKHFTLTWAHRGRVLATLAPNKLRLATFTISSDYNRQLGG